MPICFIFFTLIWDNLKLTEKLQAQYKNFFFTKVSKSKLNTLVSIPWKVHSLLSYNHDKTIQIRKVTFLPLFLRHHSNLRNCLNDALYLKRTQFRIWHQIYHHVSLSLPAWNSSWNFVSLSLSWYFLKITG